MNAVVKPQSATSVLVRLAGKYGVDADKMLSTLKATAFRGDVSVEQMMALLVVADQHDLNPWTKEIYAFPDKGGGIVPVVGVDGWSRIINSSAQFDGMEFIEGPLNARQIPEWIECVIHRKDRAHPIKVREYFDEVFRDVGPWKTHPRRMLRHKAMIQCARIAFGFGGIYDQDEAERILEAAPVDLGPRPSLVSIDPKATDQYVGTITDLLSQDKEEEAKAAELLEVDTHLNQFPELKIAVFDALAARGIITKANYRKMIAAAKAPPTEARQHG